MSKESYARGFCKAAAAAGVDPVALAKYAQWYNPMNWFRGSTNEEGDPKAQQYKTDGWAPKIITELGRGKGSRIPHPTIGGQMHTIGTIPTPGDIFYGGTQDLPDREEILARELDPRRAAFNAATTNAVKKAWKAISRAGYGKDDFDSRFSPDTIRLIEKLWDDEMKRTTSAPPAQVFSPEKK